LGEKKTQKTLKREEPNEGSKFLGGNLNLHSEKNAGKKKKGEKVLGNRLKGIRVGGGGAAEAGLNFREPHRVSSNFQRTVPT